ncbi:MULTISPECIES: pitrilysin family protein [unclassified Hydrogenobaculum]|uniref:M16 family metallopeptidase n=1 Tax=unclassified Hydrogenobaculum TaxID=2622382 RepID=UPI0001C52807|nr:MULTISPECIES: pitrilysin family protein [unclassified Hydrogenobaculum]AEF18735.1 peptidase M16 domain protein [Hydrogenobaculum sp. 3684]AEG46023.1 peptidase M16 domain protein [Hydrogenobaculum sp. SHO]AGG14666.1 peptidase M16 domain protein [Hydrogenobaculum sp. HO]AGH92965.1 putative Zn-dependent peptidase [Hydrogenobaculum sp. SN]
MEKFIYHNTNSDFDIVAINIFLKGGAMYEPIKGLTNITTSLMGKKTTSKTSQEINEVFENVGGFLRFKTYGDFITISIATKKANIKESIDTLKDILTNSVFEEETLEIEKQNVLSTLKSRKERPFDFAFDNLRKILYKNTPYEISSLGTEDSVKSISLEDVKKRYADILNQEPIISVVADNLEDEDLETIKSVLDIFSKSQGTPPANICPKVDKDEVINIKRGGAQASIMCGYDAPLPIDKNEYFAFKVLNAILGNGMSSILFKILREEKGYAYAVNSSISTNIYCSKMIAYIGTSVEKSQSALEDLNDIIKNLEIDEEDITLAKQKLIGNFSLEHQTRFSKSYTMGYYELIGLGKDTVFDYENLVNKVSKEDIEHVYKTYINHHKCVVVT